MFFRSGKKRSWVKYRICGKDLWKRRGYIEDIWIYGCEIFCGKGDRVSYRICGKDMETRRRVAHIGYREKIYGKCRSKSFMKIICGKGAGGQFFSLWY